LNGCMIKWQMDFQFKAIHWFCTKISQYKTTHVEKIKNSCRSNWSSAQKQPFRIYDPSVLQGCIYSRHHPRNMMLSGALIKSLWTVYMDK